MENGGLLEPDWSYCGDTVELRWVVLGRKKAVWRLGNGLVWLAWG